MTTKLNFGIPDLELPCASGAVINPSNFAGHVLVAVFLPGEPEAAAREMSVLRKSCADLAGYDAWIIAFGGEGSRESDEDTRILIVPDPGRRAWTAFRDLTDCPEALDRSSGATFLFTRGGNLQCYWHGSGHTAEVLRELSSPPSSR